MATDPGRIVEVALRDGTARQGKPIAWARYRHGWACLIIWPSARRHVLGRRQHARWGWYVYDPAYMGAELDIYAGKPGDSYGVCFLPGFDETLPGADRFFLPSRVVPLKSPLCLARQGFWWAAGTCWTSRSGRAA
jgi:hypothetical protein